MGWVMPKIEYKHGGRKVPSVTTVIGNNLAWNKSSLMYWAWSQGKEGLDFRNTTDKACSIGTIAHEMVEKEIHPTDVFDPTKYPTDLVEQAKVAFDGWLDFRDSRDFHLIASEKSMVATVQVGADELAFGGTIDIAGIAIRGEQNRVILDLKTSNSVYLDHLIQISAYGYLWNFNHPDEPIQKYCLLRISKTDGSFHFHMWPELEAEFDVFKHLLAIEYHRLPIKKRR